MKKHSNSHTRAGKVACTVSAAALMLGVSHAATVGFNFQANYCGAASYTGAIVTAPAFGIGTNGWESLAPMDTGYGCAAAYFTLNETIDTGTSTNGLNPLPNGSLHVTWSAYTANVSGFAGYDRPPNFWYTGPGHRPGNEEVYWGFLRDGVNFGPGSSSGTNDQPGWTVDITGLHSLFTNGPFVVQMIASGDSIGTTPTNGTITNVFVIDAALSVTQAVSYPNIHPLGSQSQGGSITQRGIDGGLSTVSGAVNTDHLQLVGNRAVVTPDADLSSEVCGFIITDKPVISMSPQPSLAGAGDNVTMRALAVGVPPLSVQWRKGGVPIAGATTLTYTASNVLTSANFDLVVTNLYGAATSTVAAVTVDSVAISRGPNYTPDSKPSGTPHDGLLLGATIVASSTDSNGTNRLGVAQFSGADPDQITVSTATTTDFDSNTGTIMMWVRSPAAFSSKAATLFDRMIGTAGLVILQTIPGNIEVRSAGVDGITGGNMNDNNWHLVAITYDTSGTVLTYYDGSPDSVITGSAWTNAVGQEIELGLSHDTGNFGPFDGVMDDVRVYNRQLTAIEIASVFSTGALIDTNALKLRLDFGSKINPGISLNWQLGSDVLQSAPNVTGPYTDVTNASSPYRLEPQAKQQYFRYRHTSTSIVTNPYDM